MEQNFVDRLNRALDRAGFPAKQRGRVQSLANAMGMSARGASLWLNGDTHPPAKKYALLAEKLNVKEAWLRYGEGNMLDRASELTENPPPYLSVYEWNEALAKDGQTTEPITLVSCDKTFHGKPLAVRFNTEAMSPRFPAGFVGIFDTGKQPKDGDFILVKTDHFPAPIVRQLLIAGQDQYLEAINPKFERLLHTQSDGVWGTMIQATISLA